MTKKRIREAGNRLLDLRLIFFINLTNLREMFSILPLNHCEFDVAISLSLPGTDLKAFRLIRHRSGRVCALKNFANSEFNYFRSEYLEADGLHERIVADGLGNE